ncbi:hypothetical protein ACWDTP_37880, partial [Mycobacterium sp. NPDC003449]
PVKGHIRKIRSQKQDTKNWHQKTSTPKREKEADKKQQTKTTKHTIEFSNNRPAFSPRFGATPPA